jgi:hypothetical protein
MSRSAFSSIVIILLSITCVALVGCTGGDRETGTLRFIANGEDFVRHGFISKDGWRIDFDHIYVVLADITAYQTDPPYDAHPGGDIESTAKVSLDAIYTVDLADGNADASPILVGSNTAATGHYNAISWKMVKASTGAASANSMVIIGKAEKAGENIDFTIRIDKEYVYSCGEFVGELRKGVVQKDSTADMEMTFHFDHIFGDAETHMDDDLNVGSVGFDPFAAMAQDGILDIDMAELKSKLSADNYRILSETLLTLGHVGEGHCHCDSF